jgi:hypothetical protein
VNQTWRLYYRFDAEAFRATNSNPTPGTHSYTFARTLFTGSRITAGGHTASIQVLDSAGVASNIVSVSYQVARAGGARGKRGGKFGGGAVLSGVLGLAMVSAVAAVFIARRNRKGATGEAQV